MPTGEWYVLRCEIKNEHYKNMCLTKFGLIRLCAQNMLPTLSTLVNMDWKDLHDHLNEHKKFHVDIQRSVYTISKNDEANVHGRDLDSLILSD